MKKDELIYEIIKLQFDIVGAEYNKEKLQEERWFMEHKMNDEQRAKWKEESVRMIKKTLRVRKAIAEKNFQWIDLAYGFTHE